MRREVFWAWYQAGRPPFFVATLIPLCLGAVLAWRAHGWNFRTWAVVLTTSFLVHLATNLSNDYFDFTSGADDGDSLGGSRVLQEGRITVSQLRQAIILLYGVSLLLGIWIIYASGVWWLSLLMLCSFVSSLFYTAPPLRLGYVGLGEILVGVNMGSFMTVGTAAAVAGHYVTGSLSLSLPIALLVASILYFQSLPDIPSDEAIGKRTLAVRLGRDRALWGLRGLVGAAFLTIILLVWFRAIHPLALVALLGIFQFMKIDKMVQSSTDWRDLHERGGGIRALYLAIGLTIILSVAVSG